MLIYVVKDEEIMMNLVLSGKSNNLNLNVVMRPVVATPAIKSYNNWQ